MPSPATSVKIHGFGWCERFSKLVKYKADAEEATDAIERNAHLLEMTRLRLKGFDNRFSAALAEHHSDALMDKLMGAWMNKPPPKP